MINLLNRLIKKLSKEKHFWVTDGEMNDFIKFIGRKYLKNNPEDFIGIFGEFRLYFKYKDVKFIWRYLNDIDPAEQEVFLSSYKCIDDEGVRVKYDKTREIILTQKDLDEFVIKSIIT